MSCLAVLKFDGAKNAFPRHLVIHDERPARAKSVTRWAMRFDGRDRPELTLMGVMQVILSS
jgi:hypothetical protein